jgi:CRISPR-associated exonuclease Cas4
LNAVVIWLLVAIGIVILLLIVLEIRTRRSESSYDEIVYDDSGIQKVPEKPLFDSELRLAGKPDFLLKKDGVLIPVEMKSTQIRNSAYDNHLYQLLAYCRLTEKTYGERPPFGILRYRNKAIKISYTIEKEAALSSVIAAMRSDIQNGVHSRSHQQPSRCLNCGYRGRCPEKLS